MLSLSFHLICCCHWAHNILHIRHNMVIYIFDFRVHTQATSTTSSPYTKTNEWQMKTKRTNQGKNRVYICVKSAICHIKWHLLRKILLLEMCLVSEWLYEKTSHNIEIRATCMANFVKQHQLCQPHMWLLFVCVVVHRMADIAEWASNLE